ncbi:uncharacterized protein [Nothobranchius furzeri]|uniref:Uncharacterized protein n=1 Tax=Nothobranchius furzeri TaxID=105023 RepID=A0A1A8U5N0_NOTFU
MSRFRFLTVHLLGGSLLLLLSAVCEAQYYDDVTPAPDYDSSSNFTFEYSFYSNTSVDDLDKFFVSVDEQEEEEEEVTATVAMTTSKETTEGISVRLPGASSLPVTLEFRTLIWSLMILMMVLRLQQL